MSADEQRKLAAIMFTDMVGYSALSQRDEKLAQELLEEHRRLLREIFPRFNGTEIKTIGDAFLVEFGSALEAAQCAIEIQRTLAKRDTDAPADRQIQVRIGVHIGDVVHRGGDVYGDGVNIASRIEPVAGPGGICVSMDVERQIRNALEARFEKLAPTELKNISVPMDLFRIVLPWERPSPTAAKSEIRKRQSGSDKSETGTRSRRIFTTSVAIVLISAGLLGYQLWRTRNQRAPRQDASPARTEAATIPAKSIAVLPFENLSRDPDNAFFADGVQDEILTDLAKVADLKVISRTSVIAYRDITARNLRKIGQELGVAHLLEGSVQRAGNRVRVNAQLIDAHNDAHLWAQTYDRDLADIFTIQSEIAKAIADQLQAKLSPSERQAIERAPTSNLAAFDLYARAKDLLRIANPGKAELLRAIDFLDQAVARDPSFFDAYCQLATAHGSLYSLNIDRTPARFALAAAAAEAAGRLRPDAGETHLARARNLYYGPRDYKAALAELEVAGRTLPNDPQVAELKGYIKRRQGRDEEAIRDLERAIELDPRNAAILGQVAISYHNNRRYAEERSAFNRILLFTPNDAFAQEQRAYVDFEEKADSRPYHEVLDSIRRTNPAAIPTIAADWLYCALAEHDAAAATDASVALGEDPVLLGWADNIRFSRPFVQGVIARMSNDPAKARTAFTAARAEQEKILQAQPDDPAALCVLGLIDAALGRKDDALREGRRAVELLPIEKDAKHGIAMNKYLAMIAAWIGEKNLACQQLAIAVSQPNDLGYGQLKLMPFWDPLRGDPCFEKIVASLAPKDN
jgi:adenylate cyclase